MKLILYSICVFITLSSQSWSQVVTTSAPVLQMVSDPVTSSLGGNGVSYIGREARLASFSYNPALLGYQAFQNVDRGNQFHTADISYSAVNPDLGVKMYVADVFGTTSLETLPLAIGYGFRYFNEGESNVLDEEGNNLGSFSQYEYMAGVSLGGALTPLFHFGLGIKYIHSVLISSGVGELRDEFSGVHPGGVLTFDLGMLGVFDEGRYTLGGSITNFYFGRGISYQKGVHDPLPVTGRIGGSMPLYEGDATRTSLHYETSLLLLSRSVSKPLAHMGHSIGVETKFGETQAFNTRFGLYTEPKEAGGRTRFTFGVGFTVNETVNFSAGYFVSGASKEAITASNPLQLTLGLRY